MKNNEDNNFRALDGASEKQNSRKENNVPDTYADVLAGDPRHPMRSESSYENTDLINVPKGFSATAGIGLINHQILDENDSSVGLAGTGGKIDPED